MRLAFAAALLLAPFLATAAPPADAQPEPVLSGYAWGDAVLMGEVADPSDDAREMTPRGAQRTVAASCVHSVRRPECVIPMQRLPEPAPLGLPARPELELLSLSLAETPHDLIVTFELAGLPNDITSVPRDDEILHYDVNFDAGLAGMLSVKVEEDEAFAFLWGGEDHADWFVPLSVEPGTPGMIHAAIPRSFFRNGTQGLGFTEALARTMTDVRPSAAPCGWASAATPHAGWSASPQARTEEVVDSSAKIQNVTFSLPAAASQLVESPHGVDDPSDGGGSADPEYEILATTILENATHIGVEASLLRASAETSAYYWGGIVLPGVDAYAGSLAPLGERSTWSGVFHKDGETWQHVPTPVEFAIVAGEPGTVRFSWLRSDLGNPPVGALLSQVEFFVWHYGGPYHEIEPIGSTVGVGTGCGDVEADDDDLYEPGRPYHLRTAPATSAAPLPTSHVEDATDDVVIPLDVAALDPEYAASVDITFTEVIADKPGASRVALGIRDLGDVRVPTGYDAVAYATAVETADGPFMAVFYLRETSKEFFCAPDVTVFAEASLKRDPYAAIFTPIEGAVAGAPSAAGGGEGMIIFRVPNTCFGEGQGDSLAGSRLASGTYLIRNDPVGPEVTTLDQVSADTPVVLGAAAIPPAPAPWYEAPMGVREFWNILGVALAVAGGGIALVAKQRRSTVLQRQLTAVDETHARERNDPAAWKKAMAARRVVAGDLLQRRRLRPDEVLVIERRIDLLAGELAEMPKPLPVVAAGTVLFERYRIERFLGEGGQGRAFLARDLTLDREVVLKTLPTGGLDPSARRALLAEARLAAGIKHPNVVPVLDVRDTGQDAVLILEYVEGGSLRGLIERRGALPAREALRIFRGVLAGLQAAHEHGIVHRDVKPENVLLAKDGTPKLADFGAARDARPGATVLPQTAGTLAYMSPEQVRGVQVDARSDLYAATAMLVEMLTGKPYLPLGDADQFQARAMILERDPEVHLAADQLGLAGFVLKGLAKSPAERHASASDMLMSLDAASAG